MKDILIVTCSKWGSRVGSRIIDDVADIKMERQIITTVGIRSSLNMMLDCPELKANCAPTSKMELIT